MSRNDSRTSDPSRRWFDLAGLGDNYERRLADQLKGLETLRAICEGRTILDLGCAEGLIALECLRYGATFATGYELMQERVDAANKFATDRRAAAVFFCRNVEATPLPEVDISLALAIAHKLRNPRGFLQRVAAATRLYIVLRLPDKSNRVILDARSGGQPFDTVEILADYGFHNFLESRGHNNEWVGYFVRKGSSGQWKTRTSEN